MTTLSQLNEIFSAKNYRTELSENQFGFCKKNVWYWVETIGSDFIYPTQSYSQNTGKCKKGFATRQNIRETILKVTGIAI